MNNRLILAALGAVFFLMAFNWPMSHPHITSTFGESRGDHFHDGIDIISNDFTVYPVAQGKVIYTFSRDMFPFDNAPGGGNYAVVEHEKGYLSLYMHLDKVFHEKTLTESTPLGIMGGTGHSFGRHLHFTVVKKSDNRSVNPLKLLPSYDDSQKPEIGRLALDIGQRIVYLRNNSDISLSANYPLLMEVVDNTGKQERFGVYRLKVKMNGTVVTQAEFSAIKTKPEGQTVGDYSFEELFGRSWLYKANKTAWKEGKNHITVQAWDFNGNMSEKSFTLNVTFKRE